MNAFSKLFASIDLAIQNPGAVRKSHEAANTVMPASPHQGIMVTPAEIKRRAVDVFDKACKDGNYAYLKAVATLSEVKQTNHVTGISFAFETPQTAKLVFDWCCSEYGDCIEDTSLQLTCRGNPTAFQIASAQQGFVEAIAIDLSKIERPIFVGSTRVPGVSESAEQITGIVKITGRAFAGLIEGVQKHIDVKAATFHATQENDVGQKIPSRQKARAYLTSILAQCMAQRQTSGLMETQAAGELDANLADNLARRIQLLKRRIGITSGYMTPALAKGVQGELKRAIKEADPIDIAASACILWEFGTAVKNGNASVLAMDKANWDQPGQPAHSPGRATATQQVLSAPDPSVPTKVEEELLTTDELALRIKYDARTIRDRLKDSVLLNGVHYVQPFGGRKILYKWNAVKELMGVGHGAE